MTTKTGFSIQNRSAQETAGPVTYIVVGMNRGGTSSISAALNALNIPMGESFYPPIFEDKALAEAFRAKKWREVKRLASHYSTTFGTYGWKLPDSIWQLSRIHKLFTNPRYIFVYRDLFAVSARVHDVHQRDIHEAMRNALRGYSAIETFCRRKSPTCLHVSYEKLLLNKEAFADILLNFLNREPHEGDRQNILSAIDPNSPAYSNWVDKTQQEKALKAAGYWGHLDGVNAKSVGGWLKSDTNENKRVDIYVNEQLIASVEADRLRDDLKSKGVDENGHIGFRYTFTTPLAKSDVVKVCVHNTQLQLIGSPKAPKNPQ